MNKAGLATLMAHRPTCIALCVAGGVHLVLTAVGLPAWPCPLRAATGLPCPGCGLTRASALLLAGHPREALAMHAFAPVAVVGMVFVVVGAISPAAQRDYWLQLLRRIDAIPHLSTTLALVLVIYWLSRIFLDGRG